MYSSLRVFIKFLLLSMHMPLRQQVRGDGFPTHNHRRRQQSEADGSPNQEAHAVKHKGYRKTHSQDSPSDRLGTRPSDNFHQKACCEQQVVNLQSQVLFAPRLLGIQEHRQYLHDRGHEPENTSNYNSSAQAG